VRDRLRELHRDGERMTTTALVARGHADLIAAAQSYAKSWNKALAKAKVPVTQVHQAWSATLVLVLEGIRALHREGVRLNVLVLRMLWSRHSRSIEHSLLPRPSLTSALTLLVNHHPTRSETDPRFKTRESSM
jgi:hypothetical protein